MFVVSTSYKGTTSKIEWLAWPQLDGDIDSLVPEAWLESRESIPSTWMGAFTHMMVIIALGGYTDEIALLSRRGREFEKGEERVIDGSILHLSADQSSLVGDRNWDIDLFQDNITMWRLWAWES